MVSEIKRTKEFLFEVIICLFFGFIFLSCQPAQEDRLNILFILADDLGWNQVGYHGVDFYETGNIDQLSCRWHIF